MIHLVGPGASGKSTVGNALAKRLGWRFVDLDAEFMRRFGDINGYIEQTGYEAYAGQNLELGRELISRAGDASVIALSSGFMVYPLDINPEYQALRQYLNSSPSTFVLLASLEFESCVAETVRRQLMRPFSGSAAEEERKVRERFPIYSALPVKKVATVGTVEETVEKICSMLSAQQTAAPDPPCVHAFC